ncbi:C-type lectin domain family 4 member C-like [Colossoma macropomum]|uniref:C-type lectin domain family 4 member C-like n=1 Tax=Colossoma macropomum TaxID=42526 RepID=UPI001864EB42|nr:C-type lectin domain family 4 member C-like [Colossoma macropomum]
MDIQNEPVHAYQNVEALHKSSRSNARHGQHRALRLAALCIGVMCILQATLNIVLRLYFTFQVDTSLLYTGCNNQSVERDQLQTCYNNLAKERDQLQTSNTHLAKERDQLQTSNTHLAKERDQLQTSNTNLAKGRDALQRKLSDLDENINKVGWIYFSSSIYYMSTEKRSWTESRQDCNSKGADLVIINSRKEQEFVEMIRRGQEAWIGLSDISKENGWKWVDGSTLTTRFWCSREPNNYEGNEDCVITGYAPQDGRPITDILNTWNDFTCSVQFSWICEKKVSI